MNNAHLTLYDIYFILHLPVARDAGFAQAALAGLASKENFKSVELRRSDSATLAHGQRLDPFSDLMLLHVKGEDVTMFFFTHYRFLKLSRKLEFV